MIPQVLTSIACCRTDILGCRTPLGLFFNSLMLGNSSSARSRCCGVATGTSSNAADIPAYLLAEIAGALPVQTDSTSLASDEQTGHLVSSCQLKMHLLSCSPVYADITSNNDCSGTYQQRSVHAYLASLPFVCRMRSTCHASHQN